MNIIFLKSDSAFIFILRKGECEILQRRECVVYFEPYSLLILFVESSVFYREIDVLASYFVESMRKTILLNDSFVFWLEKES